MKLYGFPPSPNTWKVRAVAAHLRVPLDFEFVDLTKGGSHTPDYLALNPTGRAPTLVDGDFKLWESTAIMQYVASKSPNTLWPNDARTRADIMRWQSWDLAHWGKEALRSAAVPAAGEEVPESRPTRRCGRRQAVSSASTRKRKCSTRTWRSSPTWSARTSRSPTFRSRRRCSTPRRRTCRWRPTGTYSNGSAASRLCRAGSRPRRNSPPPRPEPDTQPDGRL